MLVFVNRCTFRCLPTLTRHPSRRRTAPQNTRPKKTVLFGEPSALFVSVCFHPPAVWDSAGTAEWRLNGMLRSAVQVPALRREHATSTERGVYQQLDTTDGKRHGRTIKQFPGQKEFVLRAHFGLPSGTPCTCESSQAHVLRRCPFCLLRARLGA